MKFEVLDVAGRTLKTLDEGWYAAGQRQDSRDGTDAKGRRCSAGVYFLCLDEQGARESVPVVLAK